MQYLIDENNYFVDINKSEIWDVHLTINIDGAIGHEQAKKRPCLVIRSNRQVELATIIPLTSNLAATRFSYTYKIPKTYQNKLRKDSIALIFQVRSLSFIRFEEYIGVLEENEFENIKTLIQDYFS